MVRVGDEYLSRLFVGFFISFTCSKADHCKVFKELAPDSTATNHENIRMLYFIEKLPAQYHFDTICSVVLGFVVKSFDKFFPVFFFGGKFGQNF